MGKRQDVTDREIQTAKAANVDVWLVCSRRHGQGQLLLRASASGRKTFYFRQSLGGGVRDTFLIGDYHPDKTREGTFTLVEARTRFDEYIKILNDGARSVREHLAGQQRKADAAEQAERAALTAATAGEQAERARVMAEVERRAKFNLAALLHAYWQHLERSRKQSASDVENMLTNHVILAHPGLAARPAAEIRSGDLRPVLAKVIEAGKGRTAGKLRSYIRAAYSLAIKSENDPTSPASVMGFDIEINPADAVPSLNQFNRRGERNLSTSELKHYIEAVSALKSESVRTALLLALYLGGQRPTQLVRARAEDLDLEALTVRLRDAKGARSQARLHVLPLTEKTRDLFSRLVDNNPDAASLFSTDGKTTVRVETLSTVVTQISKSLVNAKLIQVPFQMRDLRRTCETMLAALGVTKDIRAQLLSHGLSGVQTANYDRHDYMNEKRQALVVWQAKLEEITTEKNGRAKVIAGAFHAVRSR